MPTVTLHPSEDKSQLLARITNSDQADEITEELIKELFLKTPFTRYFYNDGAVYSLVNEYRQLDNLEAPLEAVIAERRDAEIEIIVSPDKLQASACVTVAYAGKNVSASQLIIAARQAGITAEPIMKNIAGLAAKARQAEPGEQATELIAEGTPPIDGTDGYIEQLAPTLKERMLRPQQREDGTVDMRDLGNISTVNAGDPLMRRYPGQPGIDGVAVNGEPISAKAGKELLLIPGEGAKTAPDDPHLLVADKEGIPRLIEGGMAVDDVLELDKVDLSTGNIEYSGSVIIKGDVAEDMHVTAVGDISVLGIVESAMIESGGDVVIGEGVIGHHVEGGNPASEFSARIVAGGDIHAKYAQNVDLSSDKSVTIEKYMFHSKVSALDTIWVGGDQKPNGRLMGGFLKAGRSIQAGVIGTPSGAKMKLDLSLLLSGLDEEIRQLTEQLKGQADNMLSLEKSMRRLNISDPKQRSTFTKTKEALDQMRGHLLPKQAELSDKKAQKEQLMDSAMVVAYDQLFPQVTVTMLNRKVISSREHGPVKVLFNEGELQIAPLDK